MSNNEIYVPSEIYYVGRHRKDDGWFLYKSITDRRVTTKISFPSMLEALEGFKAIYPNDWIDAKIGGCHGYYMPIQEWIEACDDGCFIDYDGCGDLLLGETFAEQDDLGLVKPSKRHLVDTEKCDGILWYNK